MILLLPHPGRYAWEDPDMGWWLPDPDLDQGESALWRTSANHEQDRKRQVGGTLVLTERRLLFTPGRFDKATGGQSWSAPRGAVTVVEEVPRTRGLRFGAAAAGNRRRMRLSTVLGPDQLFLVNQLQEKITALHELLGLTVWHRGDA